MKGTVNKWRKHEQQQQQNSKNNNKTAKTVVSRVFVSLPQPKPSTCQALALFKNRSCPWDWSSLHRWRNSSRKWSDHLGFCLQWCWVFFFLGGGGFLVQGQVFFVLNPAFLKVFATGSALNMQDSPGEYVISIHGPFESNTLSHQKHSYNHRKQHILRKSNVKKTPLGICVWPEKNMPKQCGYC